MGRASNINVTESEFDEIGSSYYLDDIKQKDIALKFGFSQPVITKICNEWFYKNKEKIKSKKTEAEIASGNCEPTPIYTIADCKTNPELLTKDYYHTITVMSGV